MSTLKQIEAHRLNAASSTGPSTPERKDRRNLELLINLHAARQKTAPPPRKTAQTALQPDPQPKSFQSLAPQIGSVPANLTIPAPEPLPETPPEGGLTY